MIQADVFFVDSDNEVRLENLRALDGTPYPAATVTYAVFDLLGTQIQAPAAMLPDAGAPGSYVANFDAVANDIRPYAGSQVQLIIQATASPTLRRLWEVLVGVRVSGAVPVNPTPGCH